MKRVRDAIFFLCLHVNNGNDYIILIIMSYTGTDTDCIIFVTDNEDISNVPTDFDLSDILCPVRIW